MDIVEFVGQHKLAYRKYFMDHSRMARYGETPRFRTHAQGDVDLPDGRFTKSEIVLEFMEHPPTHWASNAIEQEDGRFYAYIFVDPQLIEFDAELRKMILAEEWLEVMVGIADPEKRGAKRTASRESLVELYSSMGRDAHWMDDEDEQMEKRIGLQHLLMCEATVRDFVYKRYNKKTIEEIRSEAEDSGKANETARLIRSIERSLAAEYFLKLELVQLRLEQVIFRAGK